MDIFSHASSDGSNLLEYDEALALFASQNLTESDKQKILQLFDANNDGYIDMNEFHQLFTKLDCQSTDDLIRKSYLYIIFNQIKSRDTSLDINKWKQLFEEQNIVISESELSRLTDMIDTNKDGNIDFIEFEHAFHDIGSVEDLIQKSRLYVIFNNIDTNSGGSLEFNEIKQLFQNEQINMTDDTLKRMISTIDENNDGVISFSEFESAFDCVQSIQELITKWTSLSGIDVGTDLSFTSSLAQNKDSTHSTFPLLPFIAGGCGGILSRTATAPLERVKILAQVGTSISMTNTLKTIITNEGFFRGLWKGNFYNVLRVFPFGGIVCFSYGAMMKHINKLDLKFDDKISNVFRFGAGVIAGGTATTLTYPLDLIRTQVTASIGNTRENMDYKQSFKSLNGITGLYRGLWPTLFAMSIFVGLQQSSYDFMRLYATSPEYLNMKPSINLFAGCSICAGVFSQTIAYPLDVVRRRMQIKDNVVMKLPISMEATVHDVNIVAHRTWFALRNVVQMQGFKTLFAGIIPTYAKVIPSVAVSVTIRDIILGRLES